MSGGRCGGACLQEDGQRLAQRGLGHVLKWLPAPGCYKNTLCDELLKWLSGAQHHASGRDDQARAIGKHADLFPERLMCT